MTDLDNARVVSAFCSLLCMSRKRMRVTVYTSIYVYVRIQTYIYTGRSWETVRWLTNRGVFWIPKSLAISVRGLLHAFLLIFAPRSCALPPWSNKYTEKANLVYRTRRGGRCWCRHQFRRPSWWGRMFFTGRECARYTLEKHTFPALRFFNKLLKLVEQLKIVIAIISIRFDRLWISESNESVTIRVRYSLGFWIFQFFLPWPKH